MASAACAVGIEPTAGFDTIAELQGAEVVRPRPRPAASRHSSDSEPRCPDLSRAASALKAAAAAAASQGEFLGHIKETSGIQEICIRGRGALPPHNGSYPPPRRHRRCGTPSPALESHCARRLRRRFGRRVGAAARVPGGGDGAGGAGGVAAGGEPRRRRPPQAPGLLVHVRPRARALEQARTAGRQEEARR